MEMHSKTKSFKNQKSSCKKMQLDFLLVHYSLKESTNLKKNQTKTNFQMVLTLIFRTDYKFKNKTLCVF